MNKQLKFVFFTLIVLVGALSFSTAFLFANRSNNKPENNKDVKSVSTTATPKEKNTETVSSSVTRATSSSEEPSHPAKIYTIKQNETLFSISQDNGLTMSELIEVNGIEDSDKVQADKVIVIASNGFVEYNLDIDQMKILQNQVNNGRNLWRTDPLESARADTPVIFGLTISDNYSLINKDNGAASVKAKSENGTFDIILVQGETKGEKGIWAIKSVKKI